MAKKQPYYIQFNHGKPVWLAGLYDVWQQGGSPLYSYAILTENSNAFMTDYHHRMPITIPSQYAAQWISPLSNKTDVNACLYRGYPENAMHATPLAPPKSKKEGPSQLSLPME